MQNNSLLTSYLALFSYLILFLGCENDLVKSKSTPHEPSSINAVVLRSVANDLAPFWEFLNDKWYRYGKERISIDYFSFDNQPITYADLLNSRADVLIIDGAGNSFQNRIFTSIEVKAIIQFVQEGHGLFITGGTLSPSEHRDFVSLLGYSPDIGGQEYNEFANIDSISIISHHVQLLNNLSSFQTMSKGIYSGNDWDFDGIMSQPDDWQFMLADPNAKIIAFIWSGNNPKVSSPISYMETSNYRAVFAGFRPSNDITRFPVTRQDLQFYYNAIVFCAGRSQN